MSALALLETTRALQRLLHAAVTTPINDPTATPVGSPDTWVRVGPLDTPPASGGTEPAVRLFLFHIEPNREMRNSLRIARPAVPPGTPPQPEAPQDALALDVRYLISVGRETAGADPVELDRMGRVLAKLQATPTLGGALLPGQEVRLTPEPYPMEELSRVWGLYEKPAYRTSLVYLATPVFIDAAPLDFGEPVVRRRLDTGQPADRPTLRDRAEATP